MTVVSSRSQPPAPPGHPATHAAAADPELDALLAVANTRHGPAGHIGLRNVTGGPEHDHLLEPDDAIAFLVDHAVVPPAGTPTRGQLDALREVQLAVRRFAEGDEAAWSADLERRLDRARYRLRPDGGLEPTGAGWDGFIERLLATLVGLRTRPEPVRVCSNPLCRWLFVDRSRNGSRRWCDMSICGNRAKLRRYRRRASSGSAAMAAT
jgi:hypothetical protein